MSNMEPSCDTSKKGLASNVKSDKKLVIVKTPEGEIETGLKKFGAHRQQRPHIQYLPLDFCVWQEKGKRDGRKG